MIAFLLLVAFPLGASLLTYALFWYETAGSAHRQYLENLSNGRPGRLILKGVISSFFSMLLTIFFYPAGFWRKLWQPSLGPDCALPPIILVHGLYHNVSAWTLYRLWLKAAGFTDIYAMGYSSWNETFSHLGTKLERAACRGPGTLPREAADSDRPQPGGTGVPSLCAVRGRCCEDRRSDHAGCASSGNQGRSPGVGQAG